MSTPLFPLRYFLPETRLAVTARRRRTLQVDDDGTRLGEAIDVELAASVRADPDARCLSAIEAGLLESLTLTVSLDDDGLIRSLGNEVGRDPSPIFSLAGKVVSLVATALPTIVAFAPDEAPSAGSAGPVVAAEPQATLEEQWNTENKALNEAFTALSGRVEALLAALGVAEEPAVIAQVGAALDVVHRELAVIDRARREWIVAQAREIESVSLDLATASAFRVDGDRLPVTLPSAPATDAPEQAELVAMGLLVAIADPYRPGERRFAMTLDHEDKVLFRRARPVSIGVYQRDGAGTWSLRADLVRTLDVVDPASSVDPVSLDGSWLRERKVDLSFHPDMSIEKFGVSSTSTASTTITGAGGLLDSIGSLATAVAAVPTQAERSLAERKDALDSLKTDDEFARLSRLRERSVELADLEQRAAIAKAQSEIGAER